MSDFKIRGANENDCDLILECIKELAIYEKMIDDVVATSQDIHRALYHDKSANCLLAFEDDKPVGFALYFYNFSTFVGKRGLYLEDLFVKPEFRGKGYGKKLLLHLKQIASAENCGRMEWSVLNWNTSAIEFYKSLGAISMDEWIMMRFNL